MVGQAPGAAPGVRRLRDPHRRARGRRPQAPGRRWRAWLGRARPDAVFLAAAKVGGILANDSYPADFLYDKPDDPGQHRGGRLSLAAWGKLMLLGSSCIYPKLAPQPITEDALLTGPARAHQRVVRHRQDRPGSSSARAYRRQHGFDVISAMPTNLYGPGDNFDLNSSHVLPALIRKGARGQDRGRAQPHHLGHRLPPGREFPAFR